MSFLFLSVSRKEMLKAPSSSTPTLDADRPAAAVQTTSEPEDHLSELQTQDAADNELSYEEE